VSERDELRRVDRVQDVKGCQRDNVQGSWTRSALWIYVKDNTE
jgi:hypothetical protein